MKLNAKSWAKVGYAEVRSGEMSCGEIIKDEMGVNKEQCKWGYTS